MLLFHRESLNVGYKLSNAVRYNSRYCKCSIEDPKSIDMEEVIIDRDTIWSLFERNLKAIVKICLCPKQAQCSQGEIL